MAASLKGEVGPTVTSELQKTDTQSQKDAMLRLPNVFECAVHLRFLNAVVSLKDKIDKWGEEQEQDAWKVYIHNGAARFLKWSKTADITADNCIPPMDILIVWHAFTLNTAAYRQYEQDVLKWRLSKGINWVELSYRLDNELIEADLFDSLINNRLSKAVYDPTGKFDLVAAVNRQFRFAEKMQRQAWLSSPYKFQILRTAINRYKGFFEIMGAEERKHSIVPTLDIDLVWHTHQLTPDHYYAFSLNLLGIVAFHNDNPKTELEGSFKSTQDLFFERFGESYIVCFCHDCMSKRYAQENPLPARMDAASDSGSDSSEQTVVPAQSQRPRRLYPHQGLDFAECGDCTQCTSADCAQCTPASCSSGDCGQCKPSYCSRNSSLADCGMPDRNHVASTCSGPGGQPRPDCGTCDVNRSKPPREVVHSKLHQEDSVGPQHKDSKDGDDCFVCHDCVPDEAVSTKNGTAANMSMCQQPGDCLIHDRDGEPLFKQHIPANFTREGSNCKIQCGSAIECDNAPQSTHSAKLTCEADCQGGSTPPEEHISSEQGVPSCEGPINPPPCPLPDPPPFEHADGTANLVSKKSGGPQFKTDCGTDEAGSDPVVDHGEAVARKRGTHLMASRESRGDFHGPAPQETDGNNVVSI